MEFPFSVKCIFPGNINVVDNNLSIRSLDKYVENASNVAVVKTNATYCRQDVREGTLHHETCQNLIRIINVMGEASARAQYLQHPITSGERLQQKGDQRLYFILDAHQHGDNCVVGILKVGRKKLFVVDSLGKLKGVDTLCVMDFYVHESCQRRGFGKKLFDVMLMMEGISPENMAVDRPSNKFVSFLCKHYNLRDMIPQPNNFAVFPGFFSSNSLQEMPVKEQANASNRHSFAGSDIKIDADILFRKALKTASARPRSLNDIGRCLNWTEKAQGEGVQNGGDLNLQNGSTSESMSGRNSIAGEASPLVQDELFTLSKRHSFQSGTKPQHSTSWNLFGVPPPTYGS